MALARRRLVALMALMVPWLFSPGSARAQQAVDLLLVLAADVSRSVNHAEFELQRKGYATAVSDPRVLEAITTGRHGKIAMAFVEWSGAGAQQVVIDWTVVDGAPAARKFGDALLELPRSFADRTGIGAAIDFSVALLERSPFKAARRTIDVSGDGTNNAGRDASAARDDAVAKGITINGLVILSDAPMRWNPDHTHPPGGLANYFRENVIGGPGAFVVVAEDFASFGQAIVRKMIAEIAEAPMPNVAGGG